MCLQTGEKTEYDNVSLKSRNSFDSPKEEIGSETPEEGEETRWNRRQRDGSLKGKDNIQ